ncbi:hypothetical protein SEA_RIZWANA_100 [Arthrobacter phage Rizwana]|nr:hypothetical protein SEA_RIZWANA_100 [Arthrobacter phage Rizwana]
MTTQVAIAYDCQACGRPLFYAGEAWHHFRHHPQDHTPEPIRVVITREVNA